MAVNWGQVRSVLQKEAIAGIGENHTVTLHQTPGVLDAANPQDGQDLDNEVDFVVKAVTVPIKRQNREAGQTNVSRGQIKVIISGNGGGVLTVDPAVGWGVTIDSVRHQVLEVSTVRPGSTTVLHTLICGR